MVNLKGVTKIFGNGDAAVTALKNIDLSIPKAKTLAILGKSGAGKSTLLNVIGCLEKIDKGEFILNGHNVNSYSDRERAKCRNEIIGFIKQDFALILDESVLFNVMLPLFFDKTPKKYMKEIALTALRTVGLEEIAYKKTYHLSGGEKQRVAIARAIVKSPPLILADEPTGSLDTETGLHIINILMDLNLHGTTIVMVTHDNKLAAHFSKIITLNDGEIVPKR